MLVSSIMVILSRTFWPWSRTILHFYYEEIWLFSIFSFVNHGSDMRTHNKLINWWHRLCHTKSFLSKKKSTFSFSKMFSKETDLNSLNLMGKKKKERPDNFLWWISLLSGSKYNDICEVVKMRLIFSHWEVQVEWRFSENAKFSLWNLHSESSIAQRITVDHMRHHNYHQS